MKKPLTIEEMSGLMSTVSYGGQDFIHIINYDGKLKVRVFESTHSDICREFDVLIEPGPEVPAPLFFPCCSHCACQDERIGHDDTCKYGCNDQEVTA